MPPVLLRQLSHSQKVIDDLPEIDVDARLDLKAKIQIHAEDEIRSEGLHLVIPLVRIVGRIDADEPVCVRPLRVLIQDRIQDVPVDLFKIVSFRQVHDIIAAQRDGIIILQFFDGVQMIPHLQMDILFLLDLRPPIPADHDEEDGRGNELFFNDLGKFVLMMLKESRIDVFSLVNDLIYWDATAEGQWSRKEKWIDAIVQVKRNSNRNEITEGEE